MTVEHPASKQMTHAERERLFDLRCRSKRGEQISPEDFAFLERMWNEFPKEYSAIQSEVLDATKPFGSR